ncbi:MAG: Crp/Fnr family transcriptional regulator [Nitrosospira sp.]
MTSSLSPKQNQILAGLPPTIYARLLPALELVSLSGREEVYQLDTRITHLYFPVDCIIARLNVLQSGAAIRTSVTGNEGVVGVSYLLGNESTRARTVAISGGNAFRIKAPLIKKEFNSARALRYVLLRFAHALIMQMGHIAVGAREHTIIQQLCHFLLMALDRLPSNRLHITHRQLAIYLGANRESITFAVQKLETTGAIQRQRGQLTVVNRKELEDLVGQSYAMVANEYRSLQHSIALHPD